jgi:hypothetical protein
MKQMSYGAIIFLTIAFTNLANCALITQWTFNSTTPDNNTGTGNISPSTGSGTASVLGTTATFASGAGSSDPAATDDSAWNVTGFPTQSTGNKTEGARFSVSTVGNENIVITLDMRHSNTASRYARFQYTIDGSTWIDSTLFSENPGESFYTRTVDLSSISGVNNNANFAFQVVAEYAPSTSAYEATTTGSSYGTSGTWRFDMVTISAVPEPTTWAGIIFGAIFCGTQVVRRLRGSRAA